MQPDAPPPGGDGLGHVDRLRLEHMLRAARDARQIVGTSDRSEIETDMIRVRALVNCFTEIGEAAARIHPDVKATLPAIPWRSIIGMRNILVHVYWGIDLGELVKTVREDLPALERELDACLHPPSTPPPAV